MIEQLGASLQEDESRITIPETRIYVRALRADGKWGSVDIIRLKRESLLAWLETRDAKAVLLVLFGHEQL